MDGISPALLPLRKRFIDLNQGRSAELAILRNRILRDQDPAANLIAAGELVHKVAGVAGTLGFRELGTLCLSLDKLVIGLRDQDVPLAQTWDQAEPILDQIIDLMAA